ncbi:MAG: hypothetical protein B5766_00875 [Candidatus Lumbricidophila eiseniae]|uniref:Solute-binding protein family 5 domain-containing protein n=1 Tax=Candidatus Lumbricidiphila eiseniae TaxID=1969409 RepID=A0A2A6FUL2_9MICO|nr:MAG: hypothetical protein B5766_00875 [Candidatus Lumbricidophila eiseniae]
MKLRKKLMPAAVTIAVAMTLTTVGCSNAKTASTATAGAGSGVPGGTLKVLGQADVDHLDPALGAMVGTTSIMRAISRQLISYKTVDDAKERLVPQGDLATSVPTPTDGGLTYTFEIRQGAMWDIPSGPRQIVAADFARGFKRLCTPVQASTMLGYFTDAIVGMQSFCDGFEKVAPTPDAMTAYVEGTPISGVTAVNDKTLTIKLTKPAGDFAYMLSLNNASPAPVEALKYVPDSPEYRSNYFSAGPYRIKSYTADKSLILERNPAWKAEADPLRKAYVDTIEVTFGLTADAVAQQLQAGSADMSLENSSIPTAVLEQMRATNDPKLTTIAAGRVDPFLWINTKTSNNGGALQKLEVRQALEYAVDKAAIVQTFGGTQNAKVQNGIFGPGVIGYHDFDLYPTSGSKGDPAKTKELLAKAGVTNLTLKLPYRTKGLEPQIAQTLQASFEKAGVTIQLVPVNPSDYYSKFLTNHENTANGTWDIAPVGWTPDWQGGAARSVFQPQFTYTGTPQGYNYVDYNNDKANALAAQALASTSPDEQAKLWAQVDEAVMADAVIIPLASRLDTLYRSARVQNFTPYALSVQGDWTNVWLKR